MEYVDVLAADGGILQLRPPVAGDATAVTALYERESDESLRLRFFGTGRAIIPLEVDRLLRPATDAHATLLACDAARGRPADRIPGPSRATPRRSSNCCCGSAGSPRTFRRSPNSTSTRCWPGRRAWSRWTSSCGWLRWATNRSRCCARYGLPRACPVDLQSAATGTRRRPAALQNRPDTTPVSGRTCALPDAAWHPSRSTRTHRTGPRIARWTSRPAEGRESGVGWPGRWRGPPTA